MKSGFIKILLCFCFIYLICGCGKATIETGDYISDNSVLDVGCFDIKTIDTSIIPGDFMCEGRSINELGYSYILSYYDSDYLQSLYYFNFDNYGKVFASKELDLPISSNEKKLFFSDVCENLDIRPYDLSIENGSLLYSNFRFEQTGNFTGICQLQSKIDGRDVGDIYRVYIVSWDKNGKCIGIEDINYSDIVYYENNYILSTNSDIKYNNDTLGISVIDDNGNFTSEYFNYINSGVYATHFDIITIVDDNCFSGIYRDADGHSLLACFNRHQGRNFNKKPIVLACSCLDDSLKADIIRFNQTNKEYMITVQDYSLYVESGSEYEAWIELKKDILDGYSPDIILNTTGYDGYFVDRLSSEGKLCELSNVIFKDSSLKGLTFTDKASELFYEKGSIYNVIPYYEYDTIVGNYETMDLYSGWDLSGYTVFSMNVPDNYYLINENYQDKMVQRFLYYNGAAFVDYKADDSVFDSDDMVKFLEYVATLPSESDYYNDYRYDIENGEYKISEVKCVISGDMHLNAVRNCLGQYSDLGFPRSGGGSGVITTDRCFMISAGHAYTNESWTFIRQYLTKDYQTADFSGIPVTTTGFDAWMAYRDSSSTNPDVFTYYINGEEFVIPYPSDEEVQYITDHIKSCKMFAFSDYKVEQIVMDYAHQYFEGKINVDEAVKAIDSDVEAYLNGF